MYAGFVACCPLVSHGEYADETDRPSDRRTDGCQAVTLRFPLDAASIITVHCNYRRNFNGDGSEVRIPTFLDWEIHQVRNFAWSPHFLDQGYATDCITSMLFHSVCIISIFSSLTNFRSVCMITVLTVLEQHDCLLCRVFTPVSIVTKWVNLQLN